MSLPSAYEPPKCPTKTDSICSGGHFPLALNMQQLQKFDGSRVHQFHPTWSTTLYNIYTPSQNNIIIHSKYSHKLHVLGNMFVKLISLTERLPHHILHQDMPVSRSASSQKGHSMSNQHKKILTPTDLNENWFLHSVS